MINLKKIDDKDLVFVNKSLTVAEEKDFSMFLKSRKGKPKRKQSIQVRKTTR